MELLMRTLSGFVVHPNVAAVLIVDDAQGTVRNKSLEGYLTTNSFPLNQVGHSFFSAEGTLSQDLEKAGRVILRWLETEPWPKRSQQPVSNLKLALQCGGSDSFSGITANPLVAWLAKEVVGRGGFANLAETDELIGSEEYILGNVASEAVARRFAAMIDRFKARANAYGHSAEGNPSGGNRFRGLYNITLKSLGAAMKRHPQVRMDSVIEYGEKMKIPGFYFMDSPGNDLESIAGQVAAGSNLICFTTGNGSVTNFPFVPTLKFVTTSERFRLLGNDMDIDAGRLLEGIALEELGQSVLDTTLKAASGTRTRGEQAGHYQVSIWRNWSGPGSGPRVSSLDYPRSDRDVPTVLTGKTPVSQEEDLPPEVPQKIQAEQRDDWKESYLAISGSFGPTVDQVGLIIPTSLCSGQIAQMAADNLNRSLGRERFAFCRFAALPHTEGCGVSGGDSERLASRSLVNYVRHPLVARALLLEHGCEKIHNDYMAKELEEAEIDTSDVGFASIQLDGGVEPVIAKITKWFSEQAAEMGPPSVERVTGGSLSLGVLTTGEVSPEAQVGLGQLAGRLLSSQGSVVVAEYEALLGHKAFLEAAGLQEVERNRLYGEAATERGFQVMEAPTLHPVEITSGLGAVGTELLLVHVGDVPIQAHPLIPTIQITSVPEVAKRCAPDLDLFIEDSAGWQEQVFELILRVASREVKPRLWDAGFCSFQFTRGYEGISL
jgi:altronate dehydratase